MITRTLAPSDPARWAVLLTSASLSLLALAAVRAGEPAKFTWQDPEAKVLAQGDLEWDPHPFIYEHGDSVKYIDFETGKDDNPGTKEKPWQHHPWDANAAGQAKACQGIHTYVFKRGVVYRGVLNAKDSGQPSNPIRLTSDPAWGTGEAALYGSVQFTGGWKKCAAGDAPATMPEPEKVWYQDLPKGWTPYCVFETRGEAVNRLPITRRPHYQLSNPDDVEGDWYAWTGPNKISFVNEDKDHLTQEDPHYYDGAWVWSEWHDRWGNMSLPYASPVLDYKPDKHTIKRNSIYWGAASRGHRYYMENLPAFLDAPGEFYFCEKGEHPGRLYLRLPEDRDPNQSAIEAARELRLLYIQDQHDIAVTGLRFSFLNTPYQYAVPAVYYCPAAIQALGDCQNIRFANCHFLHVACALRAAPRLGEGALKVRAPQLMGKTTRDFMDNITVSDCDIAHADHNAIYIEDGYAFNPQTKDPGQLGRVAILRNRIYDAAFRAPGSYDCPAIYVRGTTLAEIAGNMIDNVWGIGINMNGGKGGRECRDRPLIRTLVHHNKVTNGLLAANDFGEIEPLGGGPAYVFDNIAGNPMGPKHDALATPNGVRSEYACNAMAYYFEHVFKTYAFNNIAWGKRNDPTQFLRNRAAFMMAGPVFMNNWFNNTAYKFTHACTGSGGLRTAFVGNVYADITMRFINHNITGDISLYNARLDQQTTTPAVSTLANSSNVFFGHPPEFGHETGKVISKTLEECRKVLEEYKPRAGDLGVMAEENPLAAPEKGDFRLKPNSAAKGRGARFFSPWGLYMTVGEWSFCRYNADPAIALGENFFMSDEYVDDNNYYDIPRNDLSVPGAKSEDYVKGALADWTAGALVFNGQDRYAVMTDKEMKSDYPVTSFFVEKDGVMRGEKGSFTYPGGKRRTVDMDTNNFLIEAHFKTNPGHTNGTLVGKRDEKAGYDLGINEAGAVEFRLGAGDKKLVFTAARKVNDGAWHHVIAEVDRAKRLASLYVDGKAELSQKAVDLAPEASLANTGDFLVGKSSDAAGPHFFAGALDFLRVSRGTLADAQTTIEELYAWEFDGPNQRDFTGRVIPPDVKRDAGAIQSGP